MSNARFSILQARAVRDHRISDSQFRTLAALGMYADEDGWCFPSLTTIGRDLGKSKQAVGRDIVGLRRLKDYLEVTSRYDAKTGGRHSNLYRLRFDPPPRQRHVDAPSTSYVDAPSTSYVDVNDPSNDPHNVEVDKEQLDLRVANVSRLYEGNIGPLTPLLADFLRNAVIDYPLEWFEPAIKIAVKNSVRKWSYVETILQSWKTNGFGWSPNGNGRKPKQASARQAMDKYVRELAGEE